MRAALVGSSDFNAQHFAQQEFAFTVAVDGGYAHLQAAGISPNCILGDFDSLGYQPKEANVRSFPSEKDESDMQLACQAAVQAGCDTLVLYGALGRRLDHTLANLQVMLAHARAGRRLFAVGDDYAVAVLQGAPDKPASLEFAPIPLNALEQGSQERYVSVLALGGPACGVSEHGLKYQLDGATLLDDASQGLSNEFTGAAASISVQDGALVVIFPLAAWEYLMGEGC